MRRAGPARSPPGSSRERRRCGRRRRTCARYATAIEAGYEAQITALYKALSQGVLAANGDESEITAAEARFKKGLAFAADIKARALAAAE